jgi:elongation factor P
MRHIPRKGLTISPRVPPSQVRSGQVLERDGRLLEVMKAEYTQGQGRASGYVQLEARDLRTGAKHVERLRPSEAVERVQLERDDYTFLYAEGKHVVLMHPVSFEQLELPAALLGDAGVFLCEGVPVTVALHAGEVLTATLPETVEAEVASTGASMKARAQRVHCE